VVSLVDDNIQKLNDWLGYIGKA